MKLKIKIVLGVALIIVSIFVYVNYESNYSQSGKVARQNVENVKKVRLGMDTVQILDIMGEPIEKRKFEGELFYDYNVPSGLSIQCQIIFNSSGKVIYVSPVEKR